MLDVDEKTHKLFIICDVPVGTGFCNSRIDLDEVFEDKKATRSFIIGIEGGPLLEPIHLSDPRIKIDREALEEELAICRMHREQFKRAYRAAHAAGWGEHIYPGEGSMADGLAITFGVNNLCPEHVGWVDLKATK